MAVLIALALGIFLGYRESSAKWPFLLAAAAVVLELAVNGIRFGAETVVVWGLVLSLLTIGSSIAGLRLGGWWQSKRA